MLKFVMNHRSQFSSRCNIVGTIFTFWNNIRRFQSFLQGSKLLWKKTTHVLNIHFTGDSDHDSIFGIDSSNNNDSIIFMSANHLSWIQNFFLLCDLTNRYINYCSHNKEMRPFQYFTEIPKGAWKSNTSLKFIESVWESSG